MIPTSLYIHIPWCIRKCPYCDFNSHHSPDQLPEAAYVNALIADFENDLAQFPVKTLHSIFIGGGTPSLFSARAYEQLFDALQQRVTFASNMEITLEANPGTVDQHRFQDYRTLGINRLSLGVQSFNPKHLKKLGRIHDDEQAKRAILSARQAGFDNINLDIMHGLPEQSLAEGLADLNTALTFEPEHLSWYQLTIEPNTVFYKQRPKLPSDDEAFELEEAGFSLLTAFHYERYEISAFSKNAKFAQHNLNYWLFGDYFGIGAGAHGKLTTLNTSVYRTRKHRQPNDYLANTKPFRTHCQTVSQAELIFEFMLNATRLEQPIPFALFTKRTGLNEQQLRSLLAPAQVKKLITINETHWQVTDLGRRYTNDLQALFLPEKEDECIL